jgi:S1-C subfamily serine protease
VSAVGRQGGPAGNINDFIQTDASINQGNSGGALVNIEGEVIGINTYIMSNSGAGSIGLGFAIPINNTKRAIDDFITKGKTTYGWLGVSLVQVDDDMLKALGVTGKHGAFASQVFLNSPAAKGGIQPGDFITALNGKDVRDMTTLTRMVGDLEVGDKAVFTLIRDNKSMQLTVTSEERTDKVAADNSKLWPGLFVIPITDDVRTQVELDKSVTGLYVAQVYDKTPASIVCVQRGDIITGVNGTPIKTLQDFYDALRTKATTDLWFEIQRSGNNMETLRFKR